MRNKKFGPILLSSLGASLLVACGGEGTGEPQDNALVTAEATSSSPIVQVDAAGSIAAAAGESIAAAPATAINAAPDQQAPAEVDVAPVLGAATSTDTVTDSSETDSPVAIPAATGSGPAEPVAVPATTVTPVTIENPSSVTVSSVPDIAPENTSVEPEPTAEPTGTDAPAFTSNQVDPQPVATIDTSSTTQAPDTAPVTEPEPEPATVTSPASTSEPAPEPEPDSTAEPANTPDSETPDSTEEPLSASVEPSVTNAPPVAAANPNAGAYQYPAAESTLSGPDPRAGSSAPGYKVASNNANGTVLTRISDNGVFGLPNGQARHQYSKRQVWNADMTLMDVGNKLIDAETFDIKLNFVPLSYARVWSTQDPDLMYGIYYGPEPNRFASYRVSTGELTTLRHFSEYGVCLFGDGEGVQSRDDRRIVINCDGGATGTKTLIAYDIATDTVLGTLAAHPDYNWASFTQTGDYILVENSRWPNLPYKLWRYNPDLSGGTLISSEPQHGDMGVDNNGDDVYVQLSWDWMFYVRVKDGQRVNLDLTQPPNNNIGFGHVSCRNILRPGWCYFTADDNHRVGAARIAAADGSPTFVDNDGRTVVRGVAEVENWGYHRSTASTYDSNAKGSVSPDGTRVVFTSDWYGTGETVDYLLQYPQ